MNENTIDDNVFETKQESDNKVLLGALYTATLLYFFHNSIAMSYFIASVIAENAYISYAITYLLPIGLVVLLGLLFKRQMRRKTGKRMVKIYVTWLSAIFVYFVLYQFHFQEVFLKIIIDNDRTYNEEGSLLEFIAKYVTPFIYPLTIAIVIYLLYVTTRSTQRNQH